MRKVIDGIGDASDGTADATPAIHNRSHARADSNAAVLHRPAPHSTRASWRTTAAPSGDAVVWQSTLLPLAVDPEPAKQSPWIATARSRYATADLAKTPIQDQYTPASWRTAAAPSGDAVVWQSTLLPLAVDSAPAKQSPWIATARSRYATAGLAMTPIED